MFFEMIDKVVDIFKSNHAAYFLDIIICGKQHFLYKFNFLVHASKYPELANMNDGNRIR